MKEVTLKVPEQKMEFFLELMGELGFEVYEEPQIPEEIKNIVHDRIDSGNPEQMIPWHEARQQLSFRHKTD
jgi:hypothetical protein